jgi:hypothetical protein
MRYIVKHQATDENIQLLVDAAAIVEPEWITVIKCAYSDGIKTSIGRHLGPGNLHGNKIALRHTLSECTIKRALSEDLLAYLQKLPKADPFFCPRLNEMTTAQFANSWRDVCAKAKFKLQMLVLTWPYRDANPESIKWERAQSYLNRIAEQRLSAEECEQLQAKAAIWARLGSKSGNRGRRLTRAQLLAPLK